MTSTHEEHASWTFVDLCLFLGAILPCYLMGFFLVRIGQAVAPATFASNAVRTLVFQTAIYGFLLGTLYVLVSVRHEQSLSRSLSWTLAFRGAWLCLAAVPLLTIGLLALGALLKAPEVTNPVEQLISGRGSLLTVALFATILRALVRGTVFSRFPVRNLSNEISGLGRRSRYPRLRSRCCMGKNTNGRGRPCWRSSWRG